MFPNEIKNLIKNYNVTEIVDFHRSGDTVYSIGNKYILKVSDDVKRLEEEYNKDYWISNFIPSPKPIKFILEFNKAYYLREFLDGENLCLKKYLDDPLLLIDLLVEAINLFHQTRVTDKKYIIDKNYNTLIHGDFCLPNILVKNNKIVGFIDLGDSGVGDPWCDYAWCIWSLEYNLKTNKYTSLLLDKLGVKFDQEKFNYYTK